MKPLRLLQSSIGVVAAFVVIAIMPPVKVGAHADEPERPDYSSIAVPQLIKRLEALDPKKPEEYFRLAEEVGAEASQRVARELARRLYVLALALDQPPLARGDLGSSACLGLASLTVRPAERRWLLATGAVIESVRAGPGATPVPPPAQPLIVDETTGLQLATAIGLVRHGEGRRATTLLDKPAVARALDAYGSVLEDSGYFGAASRIRKNAELWFTCPECKNKRTILRTARASGGSASTSQQVICPTCSGSPGPPISFEELQVQLAMESALLRGIHRLWSAQALVDSGEPLRDPDPDEVPSWYGIDTAACVFRNGQWVVPETGMPAPAKPVKPVKAKPEAPKPQPSPAPVDPNSVSGS